MDRLRLIGCARLFGTFTSQPHAKRIDVPRLWVHQGGFNVAMAKPVASITVRLRSSLHEIIRCLSTNHHHKGAGRGDHMVDTAWQSAAPRACKGMLIALGAAASLWIGYLVLGNAQLLRHLEPQARKAGLSLNVSRAAP